MSAERLTREQIEAIRDGVGGAMSKAELIPFYTFGLMLTPEEAVERGDTRPLAELKARAKINHRCENCENPVWRYGIGDLCFPCTTGETDAGEDCELRYQP